MKRFVFAVVMAALTLLLQACTVHAQWVKGDVYWYDEVTSGDGYTKEQYAVEVRSFSELPTTTTPHDGGSISAMGGHHYDWQGSGASTTLRVDITGYVWGMVQGASLNGGGNAASQVAELVSGSCTLGSSYGPPTQTLSLSFNAPTQTRFDLDINVRASTNMFRGSGGGPPGTGGTGAASAVARATFSNPY